jgi:hypothetical protein
MDPPRGHGPRSRSWWALRCAIGMLQTQSRFGELLDEGKKRRWVDERRRQLGLMPRRERPPLGAATARVRARGRGPIWKPRHVLLSPLEFVASIAPYWTRSSCIIIVHSLGSVIIQYMYLVMHQPSSKRWYRPDR